MLTLAEAATLLGVTPDTLRQQIANGSLKARKIGPIWTVSEKELKRYRRDHLRSHRFTEMERIAAEGWLELESQRD